MKAHTSQFKEQIKKFGRELDSKITYTLNNEEVVLGKEQLNAITPHYEGDILKSVMKQLDVDSNVEIPVGTEINYQFGVKTRSGKNLLESNLDIIKANNTSGTWNNNVYTYNGVVFTYNSDGSITATGTASATIQFYISRTGGNYLYTTLESGSYYFTSHEITGANNTWKIQFADENQNNWNVYGNESAKEINRVFSQNTNIRAYIVVYSGKNPNGATFYPMITKESGIDYEQYGQYEYLDYGNYIVKDIEKQEDTRSWKITCYDKMLYAMKDYEKIDSKNLIDEWEAGGIDNNTGENISGTGVRRTKNYIQVQPNTTYTLSRDTTSNTVPLRTYDIDKTFIGSATGLNNNKSATFTTESNVYYIRLVDWANEGNIQLEIGNTATNYVPYFQYPITLKNYLLCLCDKIGLTLKDTNFVNYNKTIENELYLDSDGNSLGYTYRDVLDEIAGATASTICINEDDELEVRYINATQGRSLYGGFNYSVSSYGITYNYYKDGTIKANGTATGNALSMISSVARNNNYLITLEAGTYTISGGNPNYIVEVINSTGTAVASISKQETTKTFTLNSSVDVFIRLNISNGTSVDNIIAKIMLEEGNTASNYEPYGADLIDEQYLKDINVNFGEKYGPVNSVVFSRSAESDNIYRQDTSSVETNGLTEIKIVDNQILNSNNRDTFIDGVFNQLNGFEYYANDFSSTGIAYYDLCDRYNVKVDDKYYSCIMMNDELDITQGLQENVHTDIPEKSETDYKKADKTDRRINETWIIANKQEGYIEALTSRTTSLEENTYTITQVNDLIQNAESGITNTFTEAGGNNIFRNTGLWFETDDENNPYEFWTGVVARVKEENASNMNALLLQNTTLSQNQDVANGYYTISFKYKKPIQLANASVIINGNEYELTETDETEFTQTIEVKTQYIDVDFICDVDGGCEIYDLMVNLGQTKLAYSQNQNETTTDTVNISKGITITSSDLDVKFKADADGIRILDSSDNITTNFTDVGMTTGEAVIKSKSQIVGTLWQEVNGQTWITRL